MQRTGLDELNGARAATREDVKGRTQVGRGEGGRKSPEGEIS